MTNRKRKKKPSDYPRFEVRFRNQHEYQEIIDLLTEVMCLMNQNLIDSEKPFNKKEVVIEIFREGAKSLRDKLS
ncbi:MAG: hypothetical protein R3B45_07620 [Bdellovibrionota bacterium]